LFITNYNTNTDDPWPYQEAKSRAVNVTTGGDILKLENPRFQNALTVTHWFALIEFALNVDFTRVLKSLKLKHL